MSMILSFNCHSVAYSVRILEMSTVCVAGPCMLAFPVSVPHSGMLRRTICELQKQNTWNLQTSEFAIVLILTAMSRNLTEVVLLQK